MIRLKLASKLTPEEMDDFLRFFDSKQSETYDPTQNQERPRTQGPIMEEKQTITRILL